MIEVYKTCSLCHKFSVVDLSPSDYSLYLEWERNRYKPGSPFIQDLFQHLPAEDRETLVSGYHSECFDKVFLTNELGEEDNWEPNE